MPGHEVFGQEERAALNELFDLNGGVTFAHGFENKRNGIYRVRQFEQAFANKMGFRFSQAVSSGTAACKVALEALGIKSGDQVITQSFTFVATVEAILACGAEPVILDVDESLNMDVDQLDAAIGPKTGAIIPVHMMGEMANMPRIMKIAQNSDVPVVEDCAQALGSSLYGKAAGQYGVVATFSTDAGKTLNTGEGGMISTNEEIIHILNRALHDHGHAYQASTPRGLDPAITVGFNYRMTELQAAIGIAQLNKLEFIVDAQRQNKSRLLASLAEFDLKYRHTLDSDGDLADTLVFKWPDTQSATEFTQALAKRNVGTKNLPDALNWHFAGNWEHMRLNKTSCGSHESGWKQSREILSSCVAIPIGVFFGADQDEAVILSVQEMMGST